MKDNVKINDLMKYVKEGKLVLPDFQRSFVWQPEDVRELLVSVMGDYFIGSMLILEDIHSEESMFALRLVEGVREVDKNSKIASVVNIVLDGQQRTTALFYAISEPNIPLKNRKSPYLFYIDIDEALLGNYDKSIISISCKDKKRLNEVRNKDKVIPFSKVMDTYYVLDLFRQHEDFPKIVELIVKFQNKEVNMVKLEKDTSLEKIVETFERINRTGEPLSIFELMVAKLYKYDINLVHLLNDAMDKYEFIREEHVKPETILKVISLISIGECKRKNLLSLDYCNFIHYWNKAIESLNSAYMRIIDIKNGYGVFDYKKWVPNTTLIVPLSAIMYYMKENKIENLRNYSKIDKWYWCTVFNSRYDQGVDSSSASDYRALKEWIRDNNAIPEFISDFKVNEVKIHADNQTSAVYRGIMSLIVLNGALDFQTGKAPQFERENIQDDHIFPKSKFRNDCILNRTIISSNKIKSDQLPSVYFKKREDDNGRVNLLNILKSHFISEEGLQSLLKDDLFCFMEDRKRNVINKISELMK